jgi:hypothetical protein
MIDYATMAEALTLALAIEVALRVTSVAKVLRCLDRLQLATDSVSSTPSYSLNRFAPAAYRLLRIRSTCLRESLVLYGLLRRRGATPRLCVGVKKDGSALTAHAWIEADDVPKDEAFVELRRS